MPKVRVQRRERETTCPLCREQLSGDAIECECGVRYHAACVSELGGKCVPGCERELDTLRAMRERQRLRAMRERAGPEVVRAERRARAARERMQTQVALWGAFVGANVGGIWGGFEGALVGSLSALSTGWFVGACVGAWVGACVVLLAFKLVAARSA